MTKRRNTLTHWLAAATAAASLLTLGVVQAEGLTREQVRAELEEARANGLLDEPGEAGATDQVLRNRDAYNALMTLVLGAQHDLEAERQAAAEVGMDGLPDLASYVEQGADGPQLVLLTFDAEGDLESSETLAMAAID